MIVRDRSHPSVVMWSVANEPIAEQLSAESYFQTIADYTRQLDPTRPVTAALTDHLNPGYVLDQGESICIYLNT